MLLSGIRPHTIAALFALGTLLPQSAQALPFIDFFKKDLEGVPASAELRRQEDAARTELNRALDYEARGRGSKALDIHRSVVRKYPLTTAAAMSQFKTGEIYRTQGKETKAFDAFQKFVDTYKGSSAFTEAIRAQYEIARAGQAGEYKQKVFSVIPRKVQESELLEWYGQIIENAPYSEFAPLAQFSIAEIYQKQEKTAMAIRAYQALVDKYPRHPKSPEAQFRIGVIGKEAVEGGSQDRSNISSARSAMQDVLVAYEDSGRAEEARAALAQFDQIEAKKFYDIGRFYEKQKKLRSAAIYYKKVLTVPDSEFSADAQARLDGILAKAPDAADEPPIPASATAAVAASGAPAAAGTPPSPTVAANTAAAPKKLLKARKNYVGPPAPDLKIASTKPEMRTNPSAVPLEELDPDPAPLPPPPPDEDSEVGATLAPKDPPLPPEPDEDFLALPPPPAPEPSDG